MARKNCPKCDATMYSFPRPRKSRRTPRKTMYRKLVKELSEGRGWVCAQDVWDTMFDRLPLPDPGTIDYRMWNLMNTEAQLIKDGSISVHCGMVCFGNYKTEDEANGS